MLTIVHSPAYDKWSLGEGHPTQGRRSANAVRMLGELGVKVDVLAPRPATTDELLIAHGATHINLTDAGLSPEWAGERKDLGALARLLAGGTMVAYEAILRGDTDLVAHFMGAKHHAGARWDADGHESSGFCVYNDMAIVATLASSAGKRVAYLDIDAHHGDGTEYLTYLDPNILTASIHDGTIFPGTGRHGHDPEYNVYNYALAAGAGNDALLGALGDAVAQARAFRPDLLLLAWGADGHVRDPLSSLQYSIGGYVRAANLVARAFPTVPTIFGGAGGYNPDDYTPMVWAKSVQQLELQRRVSVQMLETGV